MGGRHRGLGAFLIISREKGAHDQLFAAVARSATRQHGVITVAELRTCGLDRNAITRAVRAGHLHRIHRGVYAVGHKALSDEGRWMAAVLACGAGAVLSHGSAAILWRMLESVAGPVHVTLASRNGRRRRSAIVIHRTITLPPSETTVRARIPVTTPARTLTDLRATASDRLYRRALRQAEFLGRPIGEQGGDGTRSELERAFLALCRRHRLPRPLVNARVGSFTVDFLWPDRRLVVETDGWTAHRGQAAFEDDRARDVQLRLMGYQVLRFTYRQVTEEPGQVAGAIRQLLRD